MTFVINSYSSGLIFLHFSVNLFSYPMTFLLHSFHHKSPILQSYIQLYPKKSLECSFDHRVHLVEISIYSSKTLELLTKIFGLMIKFILPLSMSCPILFGDHFEPVTFTVVTYSTHMFCFHFIGIFFQECDFCIKTNSPGLNWIDVKPFGILRARSYTYFQIEKKIFQLFFE